MPPKHSPIWHMSGSRWQYCQSTRPSGRRYAIAHYSCPEQLGNRMMAFLNALLAAVVTNRTILWQYCHRDPDMCPMSGPAEDCQRVYRRREWIASADEMLPTLGHTPRRPAYPARLERAR
jgi:hypothetical protein